MKANYIQTKVIDSNQAYLIKWKSIVLKKNRANRVKWKPSTFKQS